MKSALLICGLLVIFIQSNAQLKVDAGNDIIVCSGGDGAYKIGGCPVASGGVEPYNYTWSGKRKRFPASNYWLYASDILDDTTKSNPSFLWSAVPEDWFTFHLKVEDAEGSVGYDSVKIIRSYYISALIGPRHVIINRGDSVPLSFGNANFYSNFMPLKYYFTPSYGLTDSTYYFNGWAKPDTTTFYYMYVINSVGCVSSKMGHLGVEVVDNMAVQQNKLVQEEKMWSNTKAGTENIYNYRSYWIKFQGDSLINDLEYKKVLQTDDSLHSDWYVNGFIREDAATQKVYLYDSYSNEDMLLYDFSLEQGDSILAGDGVFFAKVDSVIYEPFGNSTDTLKQIYFDSGGVWIEGIGSLWGVLEGLNAFYMVGATLKLVCYYENDFLVYHNPDFETCFPDSTTVSVSMFGDKKEIEIFPNPARDKITIYSQSSRILAVEIYDLTGTCVYRNLNAGSNRGDLETDKFSKGMYVLKVRNERETISRKIVIQ
jgi:hypothetical protein